MLLRSSLLKKWRSNPWNNFRLYTTHKNLNICPAQIVSINTSIAVEVKAGRLYVARKLFDEMPTRTVVSWNTMISGYSKWGELDEALTLLSTMHRSNTRLTEGTFPTVLSVCSHLKSLIDGRQIHGLVLKSGFEVSEFVGSTLLYFYAKCFEIREAKQVFDELHESNELLWSVMLVGYVQCNLMNDGLDLFMKMPKRDVVAWTTLISGYANNPDGYKKSLELFWWMRGNGEVIPNEFTFDCVLRVCGKLVRLQEGRVVHGIVTKNGFDSDHRINDALVEFYCECEVVNDAKRVHDNVLNPCLNASNSLLQGFISIGKVEDAEHLFKEMTKRNIVSYNVMIKGYALVNRIDDSERLFDEIPNRTIVTSNTMIFVYARHGKLDKALKLFEETKDERNPVTWTSMMSALIQNDRHEECLRLYSTMIRLSISCTRSTYSVLFHACSSIGSLQQGRLLHAHVVKTPLQFNVYVGTSLIDMYSKCGAMNDAQTSFNSISSPNVAAWTALIHGYARHGLGLKATLIFDTMLKHGVVPNAATFAGVLSGCAHAGLVSEGMRLFHSMEVCYGLTPSLEHYTCVVDLLGRSGYLKVAESFVKDMPVEPDGVVWGALLSACWFWRNMEMGEGVAERMFDLESKPTYARVIMSNMYAMVGKWSEKMNVRKRIWNSDGKKDPGCSWIEVKRSVHVFSVDDRSHPDCNVIHTVLEHLMFNLISVVHFDTDSTSTNEGW